MHCASGKWIFLCLDKFEDSAKQALQPGKSHFSGFSLVCLVRVCIAVEGLVSGVERSVRGGIRRRTEVGEEGSMKRTELAGLSGGVVAAEEGALMRLFAAVSALMQN